MYLFLILYDGILRKWFFPSLSSPLMILKQIIAVIIVIDGINYLGKMTIWEKSFAFVGFLVFLLTLIFGHGNLLVDLWGCLPYWFGLTVCFILGKRISSEDVLRVGKLIVYTSIINSLLVIIQFQLPVTHFLNNMEGNENLSRVADMSISELAGAFRPAGIFIYNTGNTAFSLIAYSFILYFLLLNKRIVKQSILIISLVLVLLSSLCSASRTCIFYIIGMSGYFFIMCIRSGFRMKILKMLFISVPIILCLLMSPIGNAAYDNLQKRFDNANESQNKKGTSTFEGTLNDIFNRTIVYNVKAVLAPEPINGEEVPFWGFGQGMSTQVGGRLLAVGQGSSGFALAEWDGLRIVCESGLLFGWIILYIRLGYVLRFCGYISKCKRESNYLPVIIFPSFFMAFFLTNTWGNAFNSNYAFLVGGLFLASKK